MSIQPYLSKLYQIATLAAVGLALTGVFFAFLPKRSEFAGYQEQKARLEEDIRIRQELINQLRTKQQRLQTDRYFVQQLAYEFGLAHENETIFEFVETRSESNTTENAHE